MLKNNCKDSVWYFWISPNRTEPNNTEPKLRYSVNSVRFGRPLVSPGHFIKQQTARNYVALIHVIIILLYQQRGSNLLFGTFEFDIKFCFSRLPVTAVTWCTIFFGIDWIDFFGRHQVYANMKIENSWEYVCTYRYTYT